MSAKKSQPFIVGIPVYQGVDLLDLAAPCEIFKWMADEWKSDRQMVTYVLAATNGTVTTRDGLQITPHRTFDQVPRVDLLWVPGGDPAALKQRMSDTLFLDQLRTWAKDAAYVTSVCEGAMLLASAGLLDGHKATTHWAFIPCLERNKKITVQGKAEGYPRFVVDVDTRPGHAHGVRVTGAGVSAGLDEALELVSLIGGVPLAEQIQSLIQYFPVAPVNGSIPDTTSCPLDSV